MKGYVLILGTSLIFGSLLLEGRKRLSLSHFSLFYLLFTEVAPGEWTDDTIKLCLYLYLALLPQNHKLFHE